MSSEENALNVPELIFAIATAWTFSLMCFLLWIRNRKHSRFSLEAGQGLGREVLLYVQSSLSAALGWLSLLCFSMGLAVASGTAFQHVPSDWFRYLFWLALTVSGISGIASAWIFFTHNPSKAAR